MSIEKRIGQPCRITSVETVDTAAPAEGITPEGFLVIDSNAIEPLEWQYAFNRHMARKLARRGDGDVAALVTELTSRVDQLAEQVARRKREQEMDALFAEVDELETRTTREQRAAQAFARRVMGADYE